MSAVDLTSRYKYVLDGPRYICLQQNPAVLAWMMYSRGLPFSGGQRNIRWALNGARVLVQHRLHLRRDSKVLELPIRGNLCLKVHDGWKVFDLYRNAVIKLFSPEVDLETVACEIERIRSVERYEFAPSILQWDVEGRWYEEEYLNGYPVDPTDWMDFLRVFRLYLAPCIESMIVVSDPVTVNAYEYACERRDILWGAKLTNKELDAAKIHSIRCFVDSVVERLYMEGDCQVHLVLSHGDFKPTHVLRTKRGVVIIDWETMGCRSALFDFYNPFLRHMFYGRTTANLVAEVNAAISDLQSRLSTKAPDIACSLLSSARIYRWLYYVERVARIVECWREMTNDLLDSMLRWIKAFNRLEFVAQQQ